jgi:L-fuculose-phosphate aldolase
MMDNFIQQSKRDIIAIGRLLWDKELASGLNGNISVRIDEERILLTAHSSCLGLLQEKDILLMKLDGQMLEEGRVSTEKLMHTEVYKNFPDAKAVIHTHTTYTNAFYMNNAIFEPATFEAKCYLGKIQSVEQSTPAVTDAVPVIAKLKSNNIVVLRHHGVVAMGKDLFDCFLLIQGLEEAVKTDAISRLYSEAQPGLADGSGRGGHAVPETEIKKYELFSQEQIDEIVRLANSDRQLQELGQKTDMTMDLAVKLNETGKVYSFRFQQGRIAGVGQDEDAEFLISAPEEIWRAVFNRQIDPFVATTQKKMNLRGDFARISKWYAPCSRIFELWQRVPVK